MSMTARAQSSGRSMRRAASEYGAVSMGAVTIVRIVAFLTSRSEARESYRDRDVPVQPAFVEIKVALPPLKHRSPTQAISCAPYADAAACDCGFLLRTA